ncbi:hypothetical protein GCM10025868_03730 [Angustibacter aerolatus]|uniref:Secreted protein n=1 Tax=Angustibacter aerolatus TaxID=1162965 RepID=A0ABQ6JAC4_9ACTN|nr:hypothetical protein GCM10025868_03730 [Angustibacter aerolatus]
MACRPVAGAAAVVVAAPAAAPGVYGVGAAGVTLTRSTPATPACTERSRMSEGRAALSGSLAADDREVLLAVAQRRVLRLEPAPS